VGRVTRNFQSEAPLHPKARDVLESAFDMGWSDPRKLSTESARANLLRNEALESIAKRLNLHRNEIEIIGEPNLGHFLSIGGLLGQSNRLIYSAIDRSEIIAISRTHESVELPVDLSGQISLVKLRASNPKVGDIFSLQLANGETGVSQNTGQLIESCNGALIACDATASGAHLQLPERWDTALFDARSWHGPSGLAILAIRNSKSWKNPLPHIGATRTPNSVSLPLTIAAAVALDAWCEEQNLVWEKVRELNEHLRNEIKKAIPDCDIAGQLDESLPHLISASFLYCEGEELLRLLDAAGFSVDSGSACTADDLQPSHVLSAMGVLTQGNVRITLPSDITRQIIDEFLEALVRAVTSLRKP